MKTVVIGIGFILIGIYMIITNKRLKNLEKVVKHYILK